MAKRKVTTIPATINKFTAKPVDSTGTSASGADTLIPSVVSPAAEPQTTTVTDAQPVETVGIVSEADENTLTVISGDVDGKVAEVTLSSAEVLAVVDVAAAQYADEMLSSAVDGALQAPDMLTLAGEPMTASTTATLNDNWITGITRSSSTAKPTRSRALPPPMPLHCPRVFPLPSMTMSPCIMALTFPMGAPRV